MAKFWQFFVGLLLVGLAIPALAQNPATQTDPIHAVNAKYTNGVAPGYAPTAGSGLTLNVGAGTAFCNGTIVTYAAGTLSMTASTTNYVYLNTSSSCAPAVKTSAFTSSDVPIAAVTTSGSAITGITDDRSMFVYAAVAAGGTTLEVDGNSTSATVDFNSTTPAATALPFEGRIIAWNKDSSTNNNIAGYVQAMPMFGHGSKGHKFAFEEYNSGFVSLGLNSIASFGGGSGNACTSATGSAAYQLETSSSSGNAVGRQENGDTMITGHNPYASWVTLISASSSCTSLSSPTNGRWWMEIGSSNASSASNPNFAIYGFRFDTGAGDSDWMCYTGTSSSNYTATSSGVTPDDGWHIYELREDSANSKVYFWIDHVNVCTLSTTLISANTGLEESISSTTLTTAVREILFSALYLEQDAF